MKITKEVLAAARRELARQGGNGRAKALSAARRKEIARKGGLAKAAKKRGAK
jgi:general stress protein YciG